LTYFLNRFNRITGTVPRIGSSRNTSRSKEVKTVYSLRTIDSLQVHKLRNRSHGALIGSYKYFIQILLRCPVFWQSLYHHTELFSVTCEIRCIDSSDISLEGREDAVNRGPGLFCSRDVEFDLVLRIRSVERSLSILNFRTFHELADKLSCYVIKFFQVSSGFV